MLEKDWKNYGLKIKYPFHQFLDFLIKFFDLIVHLYILMQTLLLKRSKLRRKTKENFAILIKKFKTDIVIPKHFKAK